MFRLSRPGFSCLCRLQVRCICHIEGIHLSGNAICFHGCQQCLKAMSTNSDKYILHPISHTSTLKRFSKGVSTRSSRIQLSFGGRYTGCPRRKGPNFGRVFLRSNNTHITQNTYIQSSMVTEILAREKCGYLWCLFTVVSVTAY